MADKTLLFGESFGQIAARSPSGSWSYHTLPTLGLIRTVAVAADGTLAAGSDEGGVWIQAKESAGWRALPLPRADLAVQYLAYDDAQRLIALAEAPKGFKVFALADPEKTWVEVATLQLAETSKAPRFTDARLLGDQLRITTKSIDFFPEAAVHTVSLTQGTVSSLPSKGLMVNIMPNGTVFTVAGASFAQTFKVSNDGGATWELRASPNFAQNPAFKTADEAYLVRLEHMAFNNPENTTNSIYKTLDGGRTWASFSDAPNLTRMAIPLDDPSDLLLATHNGKIVVTHDAGHTWATERSIQGR